MKQDNKLRFSIRKLTIGAVSVMFGAVIFGVSTNQAQAATTEETTATTNTEQTSSAASTATDSSTTAATKTADQSSTTAQASSATAKTDSSDNNTSATTNKADTTSTNSTTNTDSNSNSNSNSNNTNQAGDTTSNTSTKTGTDTKTSDTTKQDTTFSTVDDSSETVVNYKGSSALSHEEDKISHAMGFSTGNGDLSSSTSLVDIDKSNGKIYLTENIANNDTVDRKVSFAIVLPSAYSTSSDSSKSPKFVIDASKIASLTSGLTDETLEYSITPGNYQSFSTAGSDFDWSKVIAIKVTGTAKAGQTYTVNIPLTLENYDQMQTELTNLLNGKITGEEASNTALRYFYANENFYYWKSDGTFQYGTGGVIKSRIAKEAVDQEKSLQNANITNYGRSYTKEADGTWNYTYDSYINKYLPVINGSYFTYTDFGDFSNSDSKLYTDSQYRLNLDTIFKAIHNQGYSVNVDKNNNLWSNYTYVTYGGNVKFTNDTDSTDSASTSTSSNGFYLQIQKVLTTQDLTFHVGDSYSPYTIGKNGSLTSAQITLTDLNQNEETKNLTINDLTVNSDVDMSKAGVYHVTYTYKLADGNTISKTATVTVLDNKSDDSKKTDNTKTDNDNNKSEGNTNTDDNNKGQIIAPVKPVVNPDDNTNKNNNTNSDTNSNTNNKSDSKKPIIAPVHPTNNPDKDQNKGNQGAKTNTTNKTTSQTVRPHSQNLDHTMTNAATKQSRDDSAKSQTTTNALPQTGEKKSGLTVIGLLLSALALFALALKPKKTK